jgi:S-layer homology domain
MPFSDVKPSNKSYKYIAYAARMGIIDTQSEFRPTEYITRREAAKILVIGLGVPLSKTVTTFSDVTTKSALSAYIQTAYDNCILHGRKTVHGHTTLQSGLTVFEADDSITVAETLKVLYNINK